ncbi:hypothetical protein GCM10011297_27240 [Bacterioplanes sanyensis]|uniref:glycosyltransferase family 2 protein n=1 Tax=Bacterioplanes sanyensis TaxID=1249553 RepID=UPI0016750F06|nr:glycosyltransferase family 2 protein [Bacterioplanes sanyensis]GGY52978.1 hypothetical protein GCM10011297_27240 [Bacterioplanes sanyensis]
MHLTMNLLVKNEADIIADNIRVHAALGVDSFVVMDNGSTDGTREQVQALAKQYDITLIERPELDYQQSNWKTEMARIARKEHGADWTIANDADEFWIPKTGSLKDELTRTGSIIGCQRRNVLFEQDAFENNAPFYSQTNCVQFPVLYRKGSERQTDHMSIMLGNIHGKVMVRSLGMLRIKGGNHRAWHAWGWLNQRQCDNITVYHYPIRSKASFIANIENRAQLLEKGVRKMGDHYRRWVAMLQDDKLEQEFRRLVLTPEYKACLQDLGVIHEDCHPSQVISSILQRPMAQQATSEHYAHAAMTPYQPVS